MRAICVYVEYKWHMEEIRNKYLKLERKTYMWREISCGEETSGSYISQLELNIYSGL